MIDFAPVVAASANRVGLRAQVREIEGAGGIDPQAPGDLARAADLDLQTYSLARCVTSEDGRGTPQEQLVVAEAVRNEAKRRKVTIFALLTSSPIVAARGFYGSQGKVHGFASTAAAPTGKSVAVARIAMGGSDFTGGAVTFFDPILQDRGKQRGKPLTFNAQDIVLRRAADGLAWVGPLDGVRAYEHQMAFRPVGKPVDVVPGISVILKGRVDNQVTVTHGGQKTRTGAKGIVADLLVLGFAAAKLGGLF